MVCIVPILSFFCVIIIFTYIKHGCACLKIEFGDLFGDLIFQ